MRKICAVHRPTPRTVDRRAMISSSLSRPSPRESRITVPSTTLVARSTKEASLFADSPPIAGLSGGVASSRSGLTSPPREATRRPWIAAAAAPASCW